MSTKLIPACREHCRNTQHPAWSLWLFCGGGGRNLLHKWTSQIQSLDVTLTLIWFVKCQRTSIIHQTSALFLSLSLSLLSSFVCISVCPSGWLAWFEDSGGSLRVVVAILLQSSLLLQTSAPMPLSFLHSHLWDYKLPSLLFQLRSWGISIARTGSDWTNLSTTRRWETCWELIS